MESLIVLSLPVPMALLLIDAVKSTASDISVGLARDFDICALSREQIDLRLKQRVDLVGR